MLLGVASAFAVALAALIVAFLLAQSGAPDEPALAGRRVPGAAMRDGLQRTWITYVPSRLAAGAPLVLALPGSGQTGEQLRRAFRYRLEELAERDGVLLVYAEAWIDGGPGPEWNDCRKHTDKPAHNLDLDDVGFLVWLMDELHDEFAFDRSRVFVLGVSDGGQMSNRLATTRADRIAGFASIVAMQTAPDNSNCHAPDRPMPVLFMNGSEDPIIPFQGGEADFYGFAGAGRVLSMAQTAAHWRAINQSTGAPQVVELPDRDPDDGSTVVVSTWHGAADVVVYEIRGGGHTVPGGFMGVPELLLGRTNEDISAADEIWAFFARQPSRE